MEMFGIGTKEGNGNTCSINGNVGTNFIVSDCPLDLYVLNAMQHNFVIRSDINCSVKY